MKDLNGINYEASLSSSAQLELIVSGRILTESMRVAGKEVQVGTAPRRCNRSAGPEWWSDVLFVRLSVFDVCLSNQTDRLDRHTDDWYISSSRVGLAVRQASDRRRELAGWDGPPDASGVMRRSRHGTPRQPRLSASAVPVSVITTGR